jgi:hypothetical protein
MGFLAFLEPLVQMLVMAVAASFPLFIPQVFKPLLALLISEVPATTEALPLPEVWFLAFDRFFRAVLESYPKFKLLEVLFVRDLISLDSQP